MDFDQATDRLLEEGVSLREIAARLGVAYTTIRAFRLDPASSSHRTPPENWRPALAALARERGKRLSSLAAELDG